MPKSQLPVTCPAPQEWGEGRLRRRQHLCSLLRELIQPHTSPFKTCLLTRLRLLKGLLQGRCLRCEGWKALSISYRVCASFDNPVSPGGRGTDMSRHGACRAKGEECQLSTLSDSEWSLQDSHRTATSPLAPVSNWGRSQNRCCK